MARTWRWRFVDVLGELSGAVGDLGITLPLAFALVVSNGFPASRIFLLWGIIYVLTGWYYRVPVSVQPLKAMAVIAISAGFTSAQLASTAFFFGALFLGLARLGVIRWLERLFTPALVQGVQLGIGLILAQKAILLIRENGFFLGGEHGSGSLVIAVTVSVLAILMLSQFVLNRPAAVIMLAAGLVVGILIGPDLGAAVPSGSALAFTVPDWSSFSGMLVLLILPQLPLTIGNAVFAASDTCRHYWPTRAERSTPTALATSIGLANVGIGLLGGFPICHGAGGIAAHARFGGKTGLTTMFLGAAFIVVAVFGDWSRFLFLIPVPVLGALLLLTSWALIRLCWRLRGGSEWAVALMVGVVSFGSRNLTVALVAGIILERILAWRTTKRFHLVLPRDESDA